MHYIKAFLNYHFKSMSCVCSSCKSAKTIRSGEANLNLSAKQLIKRKCKTITKF